MSDTICSINFVKISDIMIDTYDWYGVKLSGSLKTLTLDRRSIDRILSIFGTSECYYQKKYQTKILEKNWLKSVE